MKAERCRLEEHFGGLHTLRLQYKKFDATLNTIGSIRKLLHLSNADVWQPDLTLQLVLVGVDGDHVLVHVDDLHALVHPEQ